MDRPFRIGAFGPSHVDLVTRETGAFGDRLPGNFPDRLRIV